MANELPHTAPMVKIAVQTYSLYQECSTDLPGTLQALSRMGFSSVEPPLEPFATPEGMPNNGRTNRLWSRGMLKTAAGLLPELGMEVASVHIGVNFGYYALPLDMIRENILSLHDTYGITDFVANGAFRTRERTLHWAALAQRISDAIRPYGCRILYHNHDDEFQKVDDRGEAVEAIDLFLRSTSEEVLLQVDVGWAALATDTPQFLRKNANRVGSLHLKDFYPGYQRYARTEMPAELFAPIGQGVVPIKEVISMLDQFPNFGGTVIIDQDKSNAILSDLEVGYQNFVHMLSYRKDDKSGMSYASNSSRVMME